MAQDEMLMGQEPVNKIETYGTKKDPGCDCINSIARP